MSQPILILALPRSGGTLAMRLMNACKDVHICGEASDMPVLIWRAHEHGFLDGEQDIRPYKDILDRGESPALWCDYDKPGCMAALRDFFSSYFNKGDHKFWGWKDITLANCDYYTFAARVRFLENVMPNLKIAVNCRLLSEVKDSITRQGWDYNLSSVDRQRRNLLRLAKEGRAVTLGFYKLIESYKGTRDVFQELGLKLDKATWEEVVGKKLP